MRHLANIGLLILLILGLVIAAHNPGTAFVLLVILGILRLAQVRKSGVAGSRRAVINVERKRGKEDSRTPMTMTRGVTSARVTINPALNHPLAGEDCQRDQAIPIGVGTHRSDHAMSSHSASGAWRSICGYGLFLPGMGI
ncbi:hypothetical protein DYB97_12575 [Vibrio cholerae]|nr:hypothetical protein [Vibrio cholerae]GIA05275.1 hypothetical protein VCSRO83_3046 [Vibrio cholerae]